MFTEIARKDYLEEIEEEADRKLEFQVHHMHETVVYMLVLGQTQPKMDLLNFQQLDPKPQHPVYVLRLRVAFRACVCTSNVRKRVSVVCASVYDPCASVYESQLERVCAHQPCASVYQYHCPTRARACSLSLFHTHTHTLTLTQGNIATNKKSLKANRDSKTKKTHKQPIPKQNKRTLRPLNASTQLIRMS
jgi:hypothetical protein